MRFSSVAAAVAAIAPLAVNAKGNLGFCMSARFNDAKTSCKGEQGFLADFKLLKKQTKSSIFRTYSVIDKPYEWTPSCDVPSAILPAAKVAGVKVIIGLWADTDAGYQQEKEALLSVLEANPEYYDSIYAFTVGSEGLYRHQQHELAPNHNIDVGYTDTEILKRIQDLKKAIDGKKKVGTADSWNKYADGSADALIKGGVDILLVNAFGYWQKQSINNATKTYLDDLQQAFGHIQSLSGSTDAIELWVGETGWPADGGGNYGAAIAGTKNAQTFFTEGVCATLDWNVNVFYFEAFSETWKLKSLGADEKNQEDETHWGAFTNQTQNLINFDCSYPYA